MYLRLLLLSFFAAAFSWAAETPKTEEAQDGAAQLAQLQKLIDSLHPQSGEVNIKNGLAKVTLPPDLRYLSPDDSVTVLKTIWGNPVEEKPLGMIVPQNFSPLDEESWAVVITYSDEGHIKDDDAAKINYADVLKDMQKNSKENNEHRVKEGYQPVELVGWATQPHYDAASHKIYWAKNLKFGEAKENTLNYFIRILGRTGVLELNAVARMSDLPKIEQVSPKILSAVDFQPGNRYADFNESTDKVATYGIAALVAGGVAAKTGLLKALWIGILAFKKLIVIAVIAIGAGIKKLVSRKNESAGLRQDAS